MGEVGIKPTKKKVKKAGPSITADNVSTALSFLKLGAEIASRFKKTAQVGSAAGMVIDVASSFVPGPETPPDTLLSKLAATRQRVLLLEGAEVPDKRQIRRVRLEVDVLLDMYLAEHNL